MKQSDAKKNVSPEILKIAINAPLPKLFDYLPPEKNSSKIFPGQRVKAPFGTQEQIGLIIQLAKSSDINVNKLKKVIEIIDDEPIIDKRLMQLLNWAAEYYQHPIGRVIASALPQYLRKGEAARLKPIYGWRLTNLGMEINSVSLKSKAPIQSAIIDEIKNAPTEKKLRKIHSNWRKVIDNLISKGWVETFKLERNNYSSERILNDSPSLELTSGQAKALAEISEEGYSTNLLDGVTGSGKTEVYLRLIEKQIKACRQSLVLVPEIGLTPQLLDSFSERIESKIVVIHSGLTQTERMNAWLLSQNGQALVIIGTRSGIFTPMKNPGLIIVDEEHDASFKQQEGFRYSARDLAVYRAKQYNIPVILGSATPSLETIHNALLGRYKHLRLEERPGLSKQPQIHLIDLRIEPAEEGLSHSFIEALKSHLKEGAQALIYLNRRGFAPVLMCPDCGKGLECSRCDAHLVLHQKRGLLCCHHCGQERPIQENCSDCEQKLITIGIGTERIEKAIEKLFPNTPILRIDRDTTRRRGELEKNLRKVRNKEVQILLGTQMLTKGHDFPEVSFVGIVDSDQGLFGNDFRSSERLAQSILQVAGRAGRGNRPGEVWIQTYYPEHPLLKILLENGYGVFAKKVLDERSVTEWPPFSHLVLLRAECTNRNILQRFLQDARHAADRLKPVGIDALGPADAPMEKRSGRFRGQLLIQAKNRVEIRRFLPHWNYAISKLPDARKTRWSMDVDPIELF
ncbi:MAG: primosomal protein N' [Pseudomonadota bacterium]|nr:primosomal protein N' [Pseudomonadota bacterium]